MNYCKTVVVVVAVEGGLACGCKTAVAGDVVGAVVGVAEETAIVPA